MLTALRSHGALSRAALSDRTNLSRATLSAIVRDLLGRGALIEDSRAQRPRGRGRPATLLALNPTGGLALGLDLGHRHVHAAIANVAHEIVGSASKTCSETTSWANRLQIAVQLVEELADESGVSFGALGGVGVGIVGPVLASAGRSSSRRVNRVNLIRSGLADRFEVPVHIDNNTRLGALAETIWGAGFGVQNVLYIHLSYGVGGGLALGGHLYSGAGGGAGELGHVSVDPEGRACHCGGRGCLERYVSLSTVFEQCHVRRLDHLLRRLAAGDDEAQQAVETAGRRVGQVLAAGCNVVNPEMVVVGGELAATGEHLMRPVRAAIRTYAHRHARSSLRTRVAALGEEGAALGAIALVLREWTVLAGYPGSAQPEDNGEADDLDQVRVHDPAG